MSAYDEIAKTNLINNYEGRIIPEQVRQAISANNKKWVEKIEWLFNELYGDGQFARGWIPCCVKDDCDGELCQYHQLKRLHEQLKKDMEAEG